MHRKFYKIPDQAVRLADKYEVRAFVEEKIGLKYLNKLYFVGDKFSEIPLPSLPEKFVVKTTHNSGDVVLVNNKEEEDIPALRKHVTKALKTRFGFITNEPWYMDIKPRVIVEEMMLDETGVVPVDYKFFCFHGKVHYIQVDSERFQSHKRSFYSTDWSLQTFGLQYPVGSEREKPKNFDEMLEVAERLSNGIDFVRVDLYNLGGNIRFGEMTFAPGAGWEAFSDIEYDRVLGNLW